MKKLFFTTGLLIAAMVAFAQQGVVEYKVTSSMGPTGTIMGYYSGGNSRVEMTMKIPQMPAGGFSRVSIVKSAEPTKSYQLDEKNKTYTIVETKPAAKESADEYTVKVIGKDKVAGYTCIHVQVTKGTEVMDFWTTRDIPEYDKYVTGNSDNKYMGSGSIYEAMKKQSAEGFIVKSLVKDSKAGEFTMELVKIEKKEIDRAKFDIPADYKLATAPALPGAAQGIDIQKLQNMTPEERDKYIEEMKKQYGTPPQQPK